MKKSVINDESLSINDIIKILVYRPYSDILSVMVGSDERIHIKTDHWSVILDHNSGEFHFSGELHRYYEVDTIESIRDSFGDIYSFYNVMCDSIPVDTWIEVDNSDILDLEYTRKKGKVDDNPRREFILQYKRDYYLKNREKIRKRQNSYYWKKKNEELA